MDPSGWLRRTSCPARWGDRRSLAAAGGGRGGARRRGSAPRAAAVPAGAAASPRHGCAGEQSRRIQRPVASAVQRGRQRCQPGTLQNAWCGALRSAGPVEATLYCPTRRVPGVATSPTARAATGKASGERDTVGMLDVVVHEGRDLVAKDSNGSGGGATRRIPPGTPWWRYLCRGQSGGAKRRGDNAAPAPPPPPPRQA